MAVLAARRPGVQRRWQVTPPPGDRLRARLARAKELVLGIAKDYDDIEQHRKCYEALDSVKGIDNALIEIERLEQENDLIKRQLSRVGLCPDHRDKFYGRCAACEMESLTAERDRLQDENDNWHVTFDLELNRAEAADAKLREVVEENDGLKRDATVDDMAFRNANRMAVEATSALVILREQII